jgi:hypothetical protein
VNYVYDVDLKCGNCGMENEVNPDNGLCPECDDSYKPPMKKIVDKVVNIHLVGLDGNAFFLMGAFQRQARRDGWSKEEIDKVLNEARASDYDHLIITLCNHTLDLNDPADAEDDTWVDPAGGTHYGNEDDPARMYE